MNSRILKRIGGLCIGVVIIISSFTARIENKVNATQSLETLNENMDAGGYSQYFNDTWKFNISTLQWTKLSPVKSPPPQCHATLLNIGNSKLILTGGIKMVGDIGVGSLEDNIWYYDIFQNTWLSPTVNSRSWRKFGYDQDMSFYFPYPSLPNNQQFVKYWNCSGGFRFLLTADINADGKVELVGDTIEGNEGKLRVYSFSGVILKEINISGDMYPWGDFAGGLGVLADICGGVNGSEPSDGVPEILGWSKTNGTTGNIYVYSGGAPGTPPLGILLKTFQRFCAGDGGWCPVDVINKTTGSVLTLLFANYWGNPRGPVLWNYETNTQLWYYSIGPWCGRDTMITGDYDNDGKIEILMGGFSTHNGGWGNGVGGNTTTTDSNTYAIFINEYGWEKWTKIIGEGGIFVRASDLDNDGLTEIILIETHGGAYPGSCKVHIADTSTGNILNTYYGPFNGGGCQGSAVANVTGDDKKEIIINFEDGVLRILDSNLNLTNSISGVKGTVVINDINGDGKNEIIVANNMAQKLQVFTGELLELWNYSYLGKMEVILSDLNNDGYNEIILYGSNGIEVLGVHVEENHAPVAVNDSYTTDEDVVLNIPAPGVLANDYDADGDTLTAILVSNPSHGSVIFNSDGSFTYIPEANYHGEDSFTYKANDGIAYSNVATVYITINSINDAPVAVDDYATVNEDSSANMIDVLSNDYDIDGDTLT
ncbi:MAG: Ig-like domain-containing protein, partial [Candidatus Thermoplasmatota archaeon]